MMDLGNIREEKKSNEFDDAYLAKAEALAAEALKMAEEAKRAAERLAEVKASLSFKAGEPMDRLKQKPMPEFPFAEARDVRQSKRFSADPPVTNEDPPCGGAEGVRSFGDGDELRKDYKLDPSFDALLERRNSVPTPIPEEKEQLPKVEETMEIVPVVAPVTEMAPPTPTSRPVTFEDNSIAATRQTMKPTPPVEKENDLIVKMFDAFGVDRLCGIDDETLRQIREEDEQKESSSKPAPSPASTAPNSPNPYADAASVVSEASTAKPVPTELKIETKTLAPTESNKNLVTPVAAPSVATPASVASSRSPVVSTPAEPVAKSPVSSPVASASPVAAPVPVKKESTEKAPAAVEETTTTAPAQEAPQVARNVSMESARTQFRMRKHIHPVLSTPDPFGGEHDDFMPCGCGDGAVIEDTAPYQYQEQHQEQEQQVQQDPSKEGACCGL